MDKVQAAISFRPAEIRLSDIAPQIGEANRVDVAVVDEQGEVQHVLLSFTQKWAARCWQRVFQCQRCCGPARLLRLVNGVARCRRCHPVLSAQQRHKNSKAWANEDGYVDALTRSLLHSPTKSNHRTQRQLAERLKRNALSRAARVIDDGERLIRAADVLRTYSNA